MLAVTVVEPAPIALTTPDEFTEATVGFWLDQVATRPGSELPSASRALAVRVTPPLPITRDTVDGEIWTEATAAETTVSTTEADRPLLDAEIVVEPALRPETSPPDETDAMVWLPEVQLIG